MPRPGGTAATPVRTEVPGGRALQLTAPHRSAAARMSHASLEEIKTLAWARPTPRGVLERLRGGGVAVLE